MTPILLRKDLPWMLFFLIGGTAGMVGALCSSWFVYTFVVTPGHCEELFHVAWSCGLGLGVVAACFDEALGVREFLACRPAAAAADPDRRARSSVDELGCRCRTLARETAARLGFVAARSARDDRCTQVARGGQHRARRARRVGDAEALASTRRRCRDAALLDRRDGAARSRRAWVAIACERRRAWADRALRVPPPAPRIASPINPAEVVA